MNIAICEDETLDAKNLEGLIRGYYKKKKIHVYVFQDGAELTGSLLENVYDIVFMDVYLGEENGMDVSMKIRKADPDCLIVFTTVSRDYAIDAFGLNAVHYLVKPVQPEQLAAALDRCRDLLAKRMEFIVCKTGGGLRKIYLREIYHIEVYDNISLIHMEKDVLTVRMTLNDVEKQIKSASQRDSFLRSHRSFLVNMDHITDIKDNLFIMENGGTVLITKRNKAALVKLYESYVLSEMRNNK